MKNNILVGLVICLLLMMPMVSAEPDFRVALESMPEWATENEPYEFTALITNFGTAGEMKIEGGIYLRETIIGWGVPMAIAYDIANCETEETNVDTGSLYLDAGESTFAQFTVIAPDVKIGSDEYGVHSYGILVTCFVNCYNTGLPTGTTDQDAKEIHVELAGWDITYEETCTDGILNQDESDTDCGGSHCPSCGTGYNCYVKDDCLTDYCMGTCQPVPDVDGDGEADYDLVDAMTPTDIKINEITEMIMPFVYMGFAFLVLIVVIVVGMAFRKK